ncbi:MAG: signal peptidase II, partial [Cocleimonas sp.]
MLKYLWITFVVIFIDQITKWEAAASINFTTRMVKIDGVLREVVDKSEYIPVIKQIKNMFSGQEENIAVNFLDVTTHLNWSMAYNYGAAFGFLNGHGEWARWFFVILASAVSIAILVWVYKLKVTEKWMAIALTLVLGGAVGNLIDRFLHGRVIDFIDVYVDWDVFFLQNGHFATFNVADIAINIGAVIL